MKNMLLCCFALLALNSNGQIVYESSYPGPNSPSSSRLQLVQLSDTEYKYAYVDYATNQLKLFYLNHTPYITLTVPVTMVNEAEYVVAYITRSLFDCDTSKFEYALMPPQNPNKTFYIFRQDGTILFQRDSTIAPYCFGCFGGAYDVRPIVNTPTGAKLFLYSPDPQTGNFLATDVYGVCGTLPSGLDQQPVAPGAYIQAAPNPATGSIRFMLDLPSNTGTYEIQLYNATGQLMETLPLAPGTREKQYDNTALQSGIYFYNLCSKGKILQTGRMVFVR